MNDVRTMGLLCDESLETNDGILTDLSEISININTGVRRSVGRGVDTSIISELCSDVGGEVESDYDR